MTVREFLGLKGEIINEYTDDDGIIIGIFAEVKEKLMSCPICFAAVPKSKESEHIAWHKGIHLRGLTGMLESDTNVIRPYMGVSRVKKD